MHTHRSRGLVLSLSKGFTLIELLVVIAIIGILSAVVLASLNSARVKGNNAAIQSNFSTIQTQAEVYYGGTGVNTYGGTVTDCSSGIFLDNNIKKALAQVLVANGNRALTCFASAQVYAVSSFQAGSAETYWCVDSLGSVGQTATAATAAGCPVS